MPDWLIYVSWDCGWGAERCAELAAESSWWMYLLVHWPVETAFVLVMAVRRCGRCLPTVGLLIAEVLPATPQAHSGPAQPRLKPLPGAFFAPFRPFLARNAAERPPSSCGPRPMCLEPEDESVPDGRRLLGGGIPLPACCCESAAPAGRPTAVMGPPAWNADLRSPDRYRPPEAGERVLADARMARRPSAGAIWPGVGTWMRPSGPRADRKSALQAVSVFRAAFRGNRLAGVRLPAGPPKPAPGPSPDGVGSVPESE